MSDTTRASLILRIHAPDDLDAWSQFVDIYGPLIYRYASRKGLQDSDAADVSQEVLREVAKTIDRFHYDPSLGKFRNWLLVIARYKVVHFFRQRKSKAVASGGTAVIELLNQLPENEEADQWDEEYRRHLVAWASEQIESEFAEKTWAAFRRTAIEGDKPADVAEELGMKPGSVYMAKNRILTRLRQKIATIDDSIRLNNESP